MSAEEYPCSTHLIHYRASERRQRRDQETPGSVSTVEMMNPIALISMRLLPSLSTFETPPTVGLPGGTRKPRRALQPIIVCTPISPYLYDTYHTTASPLTPAKSASPRWPWD